jgi:iron complex outermembrane receptor protein
VHTGPCIVALVVTTVPLAVRAAGTDPSQLEEVTVYAQQPQGTSIEGSTVTHADMQAFNRDTLDQAVLLAPGTSISEVGARNETDVWIRGFDRWRVPLYQDGIPIYLPVDDRIDFGRFTTVDLAEVQVSKGFASVIDGPGAMGGSINLVSRVVSKPLEGEARAGTTLDSNGTNSGVTSDLFLGSRQSDWFLQGAGSFTKQEHFRLSDDFTAGTLQGPGERIQSQHQDYKINLKAGYLPASGDEYSVNFVDQDGRKGNPPPDGIITGAALNQVKYWTWPAWDKTSYYWLSRNLLDDRGSYIKTRLYYDRFFNQLYSYDSISYTTQNTPKSFDSTYNDRAAGGSVELSETLPGGVDIIRAAGHYRWDQHNETETTRNIPFGTLYQQPWETATESTSSFALENIYHPSQRSDVIAGLSYDYRHLIGDNQWVASGNAPPFGSTFSYPVADKHAVNGEVALVYRYGANGSVHLSYADRSRFPTLFEMYSTRFGTFQNNPALQPERSHYVQAGFTDNIAGTQVAADVFFARVVNAITAVPLSAVLSENENVGVERRQGFEVELSRRVLPSLLAGINYSNLFRFVESGGTYPTDTPNQKLFAFLNWQPVPSLSLVPSLDIEGDRWLQSATIATRYYRGGAFSRVGFKGVYQFVPAASLELGVSNLTDQNYLIEDGYHAPGRQYFANIRVTL